MSVRIYWIQDNLSCHWTPAIRTWAALNNVELVPTPTYASFLNRIESHSGAIDEFVCKNADYLDWDAFGSPWPSTSATATRPRREPSARFWPGLSVAAISSEEVGFCTTRRR
jgi:hypothetical protein